MTIRQIAKDNRPLLQSSWPISTAIEEAPGRVNLQKCKACLIVQICSFGCSEFIKLTIPPTEIVTQGNRYSTFATILDVIIVSDLVNLAVN